jgi:hypothetical protein
MGRELREVRSWGFGCRRRREERFERGIIGDSSAGGTGFFSFLFFLCMLSWEFVGVIDEKMKRELEGRLEIRWCS